MPTATATATVYIVLFECIQAVHSENGDVKQDLKWFW